VILRNALYLCAIIPMNFSAGLSFITLIVLWSALRKERIAPANTSV
jgi:hypothetical protein